MQKLPTQIETVKIYMEKLCKKREELASIAESLLLESRVILARKQRNIK
jgi:hypothetical protein